MMILRTNALSVLLFFSFFLLLTQNACKCNKDATCVCQNKGTCVNGICQCPGGYSGTYCEIIDSCYGVACQNGGTCAGGVCACPPGYEGSLCETTSRDKYLGIWNVTEMGILTNAAQFTITVDTGISGITSIRVNNFYNKYSTLITTAVSHDSFIIPQQIVSNDTIQGYSLYKNSDAIHMNRGFMNVYFKVNHNGTVDDFGYNTGYPSVWNK